MSRTVLFLYGGYEFLCSAEREGPRQYRPQLVRRLGWPSGAEVPLLGDTDTCPTEAEALRHAEAQAVTWVNARVMHDLPVRA